MERFAQRFEYFYGAGMRRKLGLAAEKDGDAALVDSLLTVIAQPTVEMGRAAARSLLALINGQQPDDVRLTAKLVLRGSLGEAEL